MIYYNLSILSKVQSLKPNNSYRQAILKIIMVPTI